MVKMVKNVQLMSGCLVMMICAVFLAQATAWSSLRVSPTQQNLNIPPGGTETIQLLLSNSSRTDSVQLKLYVTDYNIRQDGSPVFPNANTTKDSLSSWIKIEDTEIVLKPGERRSVACKYTVPIRAEGEKFGAIMVEKVPDNDKTPHQELPADRLGGVIKLTYRIACTVMLLVDGTKVDGTNFLKNGVVKNVAVNIPESDSWMEKQEIEVSAALGNEGNIHITPRGGEALIVHKKLRKIADNALEKTSKADARIAEALKAATQAATVAVRSPARIGSGGLELTSDTKPVAINAMSYALKTPLISDSAEIANN